jgi:hypothetical protein
LDSYPNQSKEVGKNMQALKAEGIELIHGVKACIPRYVIKKGCEG